MHALNYASVSRETLTQKVIEAIKANDDCLVAAAEEVLSCGENEFVKVDDMGDHCYMIRVLPFTLEDVDIDICSEGNDK